MDGPVMKLLQFLLNIYNYLPTSVIYVRQWDYCPINGTLQFNAISPKLKRGYVKATAHVMFVVCDL